MKRAKLLSLFLAGSLLFQTAGIDAMATAPSEPAPISDNVEDIDNMFKEFKTLKEKGAIISQKKKSENVLIRDIREIKSKLGIE